MILYYRHKSTRQYGKIVQIYTSKNVATYAEIELLEFLDTESIIVTAATYTKDRAHPKGEQISEADFLQVWERWLKQWPALAGQKLCPCGCGHPVTPGRSIYFNPKSCKVRASRLKARTAQISNPKVAAVPDREHQPAEEQVTVAEVPKKKDYVQLILKRIKRAISEECVRDKLIVCNYVRRWGVTPRYEDYFDQAWALWLVAEGVADINHRAAAGSEINESRKLWESKVLDILRSATYPLSYTNIWLRMPDGIENKAAIRSAISRLSKRGEIASVMRYREYIYHIPEGKDDGQMRNNGNPEVAPSRQAAIARGVSLTSQVMELLKAPIEPMLVAKAIYGDSQKDKWNSVRSTINILYLKGSIGRRRKEGTAMTYEYAVRAYWEAQGITVDYHQYPSK